MIYHLKNGGQIRKMQTAAGGPLYLSVEDIKSGANALGSAFLKGLGAVGKFLNAGFTSPTYGTMGQVSYARNTEDAKRQREQSEASEKALGKAMTWVSPLNYGAAVWNGHGLDARKGEEEVASWAPAWQAIGRLGELYVGPKVIKGVKSTPRIVVNTAAKAGVKPAKAAVVAREINKAAKNKPNIEIPKAETRTKVGDVEIDNPQLAYRQIGNGGGQNFLKTGYAYTPKETENLLGFWNGTFKPTLKQRAGIDPGFTDMRPMYSQGKLWFPAGEGDLIVTNKQLRLGNSKGGITANEAKAGTRRISSYIGEVTPENSQVFSWKPGYGYKKIVQEPSTSLAFFERKPVKTSSTIQISPEEQNALRNNTGGNSKITVPDVYESLIEAKKYKGSKGYRQLVRKAQKEAKEMGLPFSSDLYLGVNNYIPSIKLNSRPKGKLGGYRRSSNTIELDPDQLSPIEGKYVPFHEGLHWQRVGTPEMNSPLYNRWKQNMKDEQAWHDFYHSEEHNKLKYEDNAKAYARKKVKEALYEDADPYLSIPGELQINGLEAGRAIGLEPFAEYPGYGKALEAANKAREYNKWLYDVKAGTSQEMQNFWKILTGNYIPSVSIPLTTGYTLYNIFNQPQQQLQYQKQGGKMSIIKQFKEGGKVRKMQTAAGGGFASLITTPVLPNVKEIRHRLYNGVNPSGYQHIPERVWDALNKKKANRAIYRDDLWATYLQIPEKERHSGVEKLQSARYKPSMGNISGDVYRMPLNEEDADVLIQRAQLSGLGLGKNMVDRSLAHYFGDHTVGKGHDKKGEYISYYDKYDLNQFAGGTPVKTGIKSVDKWLKDNTSNIDLSMGIGKPFEIYDRIYLDDYYGVPKEARGGNFLPEITVTSKKRKK